MSLSLPRSPPLSVSPVQLIRVYPLGAEQIISQPCLHNTGVVNSEEHYVLGVLRAALLPWPARSACGKHQAQRAHLARISPELLFGSVVGRGGL